MSLLAPQILLVAGSVQGLCVALLLWTRWANRLLAVLVAFDTREVFVTYPHLSKISWLQPTLFRPLIYVFTDKRAGRQQARHIIISAEAFSMVSTSGSARAQTGTLLLVSLGALNQARENDTPARACARQPRLKIPEFEFSLP